MMSSLERATAALELREPDRVPTFDVIEEYGNIYDVLGRKPTPLGFLWSNPVTSRIIDRLAAVINASRLLDSEMDTFSYDRTAASVKQGYDSAWVMHVPIWRIRDSKTFGDIYGRRYDTIFDGRGNLGTPIYRDGLLRSPDAWYAWDKRAIMGLPERANRAYRRIQRDFGSHLFIFASFLFGLFENTWQPMGFERFAVALRREQAFLRRIIKFYEDHYCMMIEAWADAGIPGVVYSEDVAYRSGPMISPRLMEEFYGDAYRRITETAHKLGMKIVFHTDGMVYPLLEWFADCGFDGVHALEPTADVQLGKAKEMVGDRMALLGNIDITHILVDATREEVFDAVRQAISDAGKGGGYLLGPTNSHPGMSMDRVRWMLEAVDQYGHYPLQL